MYVQLYYQNTVYARFLFTANQIIMQQNSGENQKTIQCQASLAIKYKTNQNHAVDKRQSLLMVNENS
ncbi:hypothetical protein CHH61_03715 [Shouchella clausii]|uniref:Uncharacterized protein n=1 Tax=Shouchella clausii TaxID=79880 RepID=A0A268S4B9_SHOCL|nr:hypothetical protein CHH61_03715 [Shouchella clausii]